MHPGTRGQFRGPVGHLGLRAGPQSLAAPPEGGGWTAFRESPSLGFAGRGTWGGASGEERPLSTRQRPRSPEWPVLKPRGPRNTEPAHAQGWMLHVHRAPRKRAATPEPGPRAQASLCAHVCACGAAPTVLFLTRAANPWLRAWQGWREPSERPPGGFWAKEAPSSSCCGRSDLGLSSGAAPPGRVPGKRRQGRPWAGARVSVRKWMGPLLPKPPPGRVQCSA